MSAFAAAVLGSSAVAGCGGGGEPEAVKPSVIANPAAATTSPTQSAPAATAISSLDASSAVELASIASNFDVESELVPSWGTGAIAESAAGNDVVGAFRFICNPGQLLADDPIVKPGLPGASHSHDFFGATGTNASSTEATMRAAGTTCVNTPGDTAGYWVPTAYRPSGEPLVMERGPADRRDGCRRRG